MIKIENVILPSDEQWQAVIRGARNPMNSWDKSDSNCAGCFKQYDSRDCECCEVYIGENDLDLLTRLSEAGTDHSKYLRMIPVILDITAPLYWWKEFDTYKVGTVRNSCSTMHKIHGKEFTFNDFSCEHLNEDTLNVLNTVITTLNGYRNIYLESKNKEDWWQMIQLLPSSYNQRATVSLNYQVLKNMYHSRKNHKLNEWRDFCNWVETLPYAKELICT